jgi:hypothetical protein
MFNPDYLTTGCLHGRHRIAPGCTPALCSTDLLRILLFQALQLPLTFLSMLQCLFSCCMTRTSKFGLQPVLVLLAEHWCAEAVQMCTRRLPRYRIPVAAAALVPAFAAFSACSACLAAIAASSCTLASFAVKSSTAHLLLSRSCHQSSVFNSQTVLQGPGHTALQTHVD